MSNVLQNYFFPEDWKLCLPLWTLSLYRQEFESWITSSTCIANFSFFATRNRVVVLAASNVYCSQSLSPYSLSLGLLLLFNRKSFEVLEVFFFTATPILNLFPCNCICCLVAWGFSLKLFCTWLHSLSSLAMLPIKYHLKKMSISLFAYFLFCFFINP